MSSENPILPTPDQPEQEMHGGICELCGADWYHRANAARYCPPASTDPPLHQRIEGGDQAAIHDVLAAVGFYFHDDLIEPVYELLAEADDALVVTIGKLVDLRETPSPSRPLLERIEGLIAEWEKVALQYSGDSKSAILWCASRLRAVLKGGSEA